VLETKRVRAHVNRKLDNAMTAKKEPRRKNPKASQLRRLLLSNALNPAQSRSRMDVGRPSDKSARTKQKSKIGRSLIRQERPKRPFFVSVNNESAASLSQMSFDTRVMGMLLDSFVSFDIRL
jgi:hypothetical protein